LGEEGEKEKEPAHGSPYPVGMQPRQSRRLGHESPDEPSLGLNLC
jgi:hypothetical protein